MPQSLRFLITGRLGPCELLDALGQLRLGAAAYQRADYRIPGKDCYDLIGDGLRFAIFYTKIHDRLPGPLTRHQLSASFTCAT